MIDRRSGTLRRRIVGAQRFDGVADEFEPYRLRLAGGKHIQNATTDRELAVLVGRVFARVPRINQQRREIGRRDVLAGLEVDRRAKKPGRRAYAWKKRWGRRDDDPRLADGQRVERAGARGSDSDVRRQATIRIDFVGGERKDGAVGRRCGETIERRKEETQIGNSLLELAIAGHDVEHDALRQCVRHSGHVQRLRG